MGTYFFRLVAFGLGLIVSQVTTALAGDSLSYSGRLVNTNGSPILGPVNLRFDLASSADTNVILCTQQITNAVLTNGVFHVKLDLNCGASSINQILSSIPPTHTPVIRVTNESAGKSYSFQALYSVPSAQIAHGLSKLNANTNEVLTWTGTKWEPKPITGASGGTVTEVIAGSGLSGGTITNSGTIAIASGGVTDTHLAGSITRTKLLSGNANYVLVNNASGVMSEVAQLSLSQGGTGANTAASARTNLGLGSAATATIGYAAGNVLPADNIPVCLPAFKLQFTGVGPTYWSCVNDNDSLDGTKLPLAGGTMSGAINMGTSKITNLGTPTAGTDAVTKSYVDSQISGSSSWTVSGTNIHNSNSGNVGIGISSPVLPLHISTGTAIDRFGGMSPHLVLRGAGGTLAAPTATANAAGIGMVSGNNFDGSTWASAASINFFASEATTSSNRGAGITFATTQNGTNSAATRMILDHAGNLSIGKAIAIEKLDVAGNVAIDGQIRLKSSNANYVELKAPNALASTLTFNLPGISGTSGQALITDGAGNLSWATVATGASAVGGDLTGTVNNAQIAAGAIVDADVSASASIAQSKISGLATSLSGKEPTITAGTATQYWRGDKSWQTLSTAVVPESGNLYYTDARVRAAPLTGYALGAATALAATDSMLDAFEKLQAQINANLTAFNNTAQWSKNGTSAYYNAGNVGINTAAPAQRLHVTGNIRVDNGSNASIYNSGGMYFSGLDGTGVHTNYVFRPGWGSAANTLATIYLQNGNTSGGFNNCVVLSSFGPSYINCGGLGIGTANPQAQLDVVGRVRSTHPGMPVVELYNTSAPANQRWVELYSGSDGVVALRTMNDAYSAGATIFHSHRAAGSQNIDYTVLDGNVGIGHQPSYKFHANGVVAGVGAYVNASDRRLKKNIKPIPDAEKLLKLQGVYFDWRQDEFPKMNFEQTHDVGVIAQEVEKVFPEAVMTDRKGYKSVAYSKLIAPLIEVVKTLFKKVDDNEFKQSRKIASLEARNEALEKENKEIKARLVRIEKALQKH